VPEPSTIVLPEGALAVSFWERLAFTEFPDACWLFVGWLDKDGYGVLVHQGVHQRAHRVAWALTNGPIPQGLSVLHRCLQTPMCCNPRHLYVGTQRQNVADSIADGTHVSVTGRHAAPAGPGQFELEFLDGSDVVSG
jgi:hypothetical protein